MAGPAAGAINEREFRNSLGLFGTGVVIISSEVDGEKLGATVSSFNSVSLTPPLVLFSIARTSLALAKWRAATTLAISVLSENQTELSNRFARATGAKWDGLADKRTRNGAPLPPGCLAHFECVPYAVHNGGDHDIFVVEVKSYEVHHPGARPLLFFAGKYRQLAHDDARPTPPDENLWLHGW